MEVGVTVTVPFEIYSVYAESAAILGDHTVQQVMGQVLCAYAKCILDGLLTVFCFGRAVEVAGPYKGGESWKMEDNRLLQFLMDDCIMSAK